MRSLLLPLALLAVSAPHVHAQGCTPDPATDLLLVASPSLAQIGEPVLLTLTNLSADCTFTLPTACLFTQVSNQSCGGDIAYNPLCSGAPQSLPPGASVTATWDQLTDFGQQVPEGVWAFTVPVLAPGAQGGQLCALVQIGTSCASPFAYGPGTTGAGGHVPSLTSLGGSPSIGNADFQLAVTNAVGGGLAVALGSLGPASIELEPGTLLVDPASLFLVDSIGLSGSPGVAGQGIGFLPSPVPDAPVLVGLELFFQAAVIDAAASGGLALSPGLHAVICS